MAPHANMRPWTTNTTLHDPHECDTHEHHAHKPGHDHSDHDHFHDYTDVNRRRTLMHFTGSLGELRSGNNVKTSGKPLPVRHLPQDFGTERSIEFDALLRHARARTLDPPSAIKNRTTGTTAIVAEPDVLAWKLMINPAATLRIPMAALSIIMAGTLRTSNAAVAGGATSNPNTSSVPTVRNEPTIARVISTSRAALVNPGCKPSRRAFCSLKERVRKARNNRTEAQRHHQGHRGQHDDVRGRDTQCVPEQNGGEAAAVCGGAGDEDDAQSQHAHEQQPDTGVLRENRLAMNQVYPADHHRRRQGGADEYVEIEEDGESDAGYDPVDQGVAQETHAPDHHPGPHHRTGHSGKRTADHGPLLESELEGFGQPLHCASR